DHLEIFNTSTKKSQLVGTDYFELHAGELPAEFACWLEGSLFIRAEGFNFFELCFVRAVPNFDYLDFIKAAPEHIPALRRELSSFLAEIATNQVRQTLFSRLLDYYPKDIWDAVSTEAIRKALSNCGDRIHDYVLDTERRGIVLNIMGI